MILIVSDEPALLSTRAMMLGEWDCATANLADAESAVRAGGYALLMICQTVPEKVACDLFALARRVNPSVKVLTILAVGDTFSHSYDSTTYAVDFTAPGGLKDVIAGMLT